MQLSEQWYPSASLEVLQQRAALLSAVREFFAQRNVLEVDTPLMSRFGVTDLHVDNLTTQLQAFPQTTFYLQTSPEYAMKRLLAAYGQSIYQLGKVFRDDNVGRFHNPEFTMLEWYRVGFNQQQLIDEVVTLLQSVIGDLPVHQCSYQQAFMQSIGVDPLSATDDELRNCLKTFSEIADLAAREDNRDTLLQLAMAMIVEPQFTAQAITIIDSFPASQAALAQLSDDNPLVARRFEVYVGGIELANGYQELTEAKTQSRRFAQDNQQRSQHGKTQQPSDHRLIAALEHGFPVCSGVALGFDRLLMLQLKKQMIAEVLPFALTCA